MILYCMRFDHLTVCIHRDYKKRYSATLKVLLSQQHREIVGISIKDLSMQELAG